MFRRSAIVLGVLCVLFSGVGSVSAQTNVFNMGGTRNPTTGTWTGAASLQFVTVGDPGNAADTDAHTAGYGSVRYVYQMGKYDVTVGQYCQFLNAVAKTDTYGLVQQAWRWLRQLCRRCGITQSGSSGSYSYSVTGSYSQAATVRLRCHLGRCGPLLQLAAKRPADRGRGTGHDGDRGVHAQRRYHQAA